MPNLNHMEPENLGPKTGMKLGKCRKTKLDNIGASKTKPFCKGRRKQTATFKMENSSLKHNKNQ